MQTANEAWYLLLSRLHNFGEEASPRGRKTKELLCQVSSFNMHFPVITFGQRKLGYKFMAAEAAWILSGDNRVSTIRPYAKSIEQFSDDGILFFGAYGTRFRDQLRHVIRALEIDRDSRQAVITLWRPNPPQTKDVPCTISLHWMIRNRKLHCFASMRSSDAYLGVPYDWFNFTMMSLYILLLFGKRTGEALDLGAMHFVANSQHLYEENFQFASDLTNNTNAESFSPIAKGPMLIQTMFESEEHLVKYLWDCANGIKESLHVQSTIGE